MNSKRVLVLNHYPGGAHAIAPVAAAFHKVEGVEAVAVGGEYSFEVFKRRGVPCTFQSSAGPQHELAQLASRLLDDIKPDLCLLGSSRGLTLEKLVIQEARLRGIPTVVVVDHWADHVERFSHPEEETLLSYLPDQITVMDALTKSALEALGIAPEVIHITGQPYFDDLALQRRSRSATLTAKLRQTLGIPSNHRVVTLASEPTESDHLEVNKDPDQIDSTERMIAENVRDVLWDICHANSLECTLLVKLHPREEKSPIEPQEESTAPRIQILRETSPREVMLASDLIVGMKTMFIIESGLMGIPTISFQPGMAEGDSYIGVKLGVTHLARSRETLKEAIETALVQQKPLNVTAFEFPEAMALQDGKATERVVQLVCSMLQV